MSRIDYLAIALAACLASPGPARGDLGAGVGTGKYALLVGCTKYNDPEFRTLTGPANDVARWAEILTRPDGFAFPVGNVERLAGWPDDPSQRPTRDNIAAAFDDLVKKAAPGVQIVIFLSGHGTQVPIPAARDPLDPENPELDGLDEVFLPADMIRSRGLDKGIRDDQIGAWLARMRGLGASVWIVFDCCHAGMMARGGPTGSHNPFPSSRYVDPALFGISGETLDRAADRARDAIRQAEARGENPRKTLKAEVRAGEDATGKLVAFYAAQPDENSTELDFSEGTDHLPEDRHGLFAYAILQQLATSRGPLTYHDLIRRVVIRYRSSGRMDWPTPFAEGDLDQGVLGLAAWPSRSLGVLEREGDEILLDAGEFSGLTIGSILSVHPPAGLAGDGDAILGFVRVEDVTPTTAVVLPCAYRGSLAVDPASLPELARCDLVSRDFGDRQVRLFLDGPESLHVAFAGVRDEVRGLARLCGREEEAQLVLKRVSAKEAEEHHGRRIDGEVGLLLLPARCDRDGSAGRIGIIPPARRVYAAYPFRDREDVTRTIERDLPKIFRWQDLWRIANGVNALDGGNSHGLVLEVLERKGKHDRVGERLADMVVNAGQVLEIRLANQGSERLWVVVLHLDSKLGIEVMYSGPLGRRMTLAPSILHDLGGAWDRSGVEGVIVLGIPQARVLGDPDFGFLAQARLLVEGPPAKSLHQILDTPIGALLHGGVLHEKTRSVERRHPSTPAILAQSWSLVPAAP